jgi:hypothetical protein
MTDAWIPLAFGSLFPGQLPHPLLALARDRAVAGPGIQDREVSLDRAPTVCLDLIPSLTGPPK